MSAGLPPDQSPQEIAVIIAIHRPDPVRLQAQLVSLVAQENVRFKIFAVLDGAETVADETTRSLLHAHDIVAVENEKPLGVRGAFACGLDAALTRIPECSHFAYCDQDDVWHTQKLAISLNVLNEVNAELIYCDARVIDAGGKEIAASLHAFESREPPVDLAQCLLLNSVTGMTSVFTRRTAVLALQLMRAVETPLLHDHITAIAAASLGTLWHLPMPLVDYVQHGENQLGAKPHVPAWRKRTLGVGALSAYRATSAALFEERRPVAVALAAFNRLPRKVSSMYLVHRPGFAEFELSYITTIIDLMREGQRRRAMLCLRMMDAAFCRWMRPVFGRPA